MRRELEQWLEEDQSLGRKEPGGRLSNRLSELLRAGCQWEAGYRHRLADLGEAIYAFIGWGPSKKKQDKKRKLQALRDAQ
jgi:hypothetical protein